MPVAFDSVGPAGGGGFGQSGGGAVTYTHTTIGGPCSIFLGVSTDGTDPGTHPNSATCDGASMTSLGSVASGAGGTTGFLQVFRIDGITAGAHTIVIAANGGAGDQTGGSIAFTGVTGIGAVATNAASANGSTSFITVPSSTSGNLIAAFIGSGNSITATSSPAVSRFVNNLEGGSGSATGNAAGATSAAGGSVTVTWTDTSTVSATIGFEVQGSSVTGIAVNPPQNVIMRTEITGRTDGRVTRQPSITIIN